MSALDYVVLYHRNGKTSTHDLCTWEQLKRVFSVRQDEMIEINGAHGDSTLIWRSDMESVHLITEAQAENDAERQAALKRVDREADPNWPD